MFVLHASEIWTKLYGPNYFYYFLVLTNKLWQGGADEPVEKYRDPSKLWLGTDLTIMMFLAIFAPPPPVLKSVQCNKPTQTATHPDNADVSYVRYPIFPDKCSVHYEQMWWTWDNFEFILSLTSRYCSGYWNLATRSGGRWIYSHWWFQPLHWEKNSSERRRYWCLYQKHNSRWTTHWNRDSWRTGVLVVVLWVRPNRLPRSVAGIVICAVYIPPKSEH